MPDQTKQLKSASLTAEYDPNTQELIVTFSNGVPYSHTGFPPDQWSEFEKAPSKGRFYNQRIRGIY